MKYITFRIHLILWDVTNLHDTFYLELQQLNANHNRSFASKYSHFLIGAVFNQVNNVNCRQSSLRRLKLAIQKQLQKLIQYALLRYELRLIMLNMSICICIRTTYYFRCTIFALVLVLIKTI